MHIKLWYQLKCVWPAKKECIGVYLTYLALLKISNIYIYTDFCIKKLFIYYIYTLYPETLILWSGMHYWYILIIMQIEIMQILIITTITVSKIWKLQFTKYKNIEILFTFLYEQHKNMNMKKLYTLKYPTGIRMLLYNLITNPI